MKEFRHRRRLGVKRHQIRTSKFCARNAWIYFQDTHNEFLSSKYLRLGGDYSLLLMGLISRKFYKFFLMDLIYESIKLSALLQLQLFIHPYFQVLMLRCTEGISCGPQKSEIICSNRCPPVLISARF
ncbi:unnamed protein product [Moneuplotes crassus]|uniref:Uncharacterized protein n=1 Tax=Euplotes crassus TaxID=5936 RepID=A0AAD1XCW0_EUPCR|nr:unnamed protein product [Moneuplotes crassus]